MSTRDGRDFESGGGGGGVADGGAGFWEDDNSANSANSGSYAEGGEGRGAGRGPSDMTSRGSSVGGVYGAEPVGLSLEEDEGEWMAGEDVDPEAEAIFFGDKVPFSDLGEAKKEHVWSMCVWRTCYVPPVSSVFLKSADRQSYTRTVSDNIFNRPYTKYSYSTYQGTQHY